MKAFEKISSATISKEVWDILQNTHKRVYTRELIRYKKIHLQTLGGECEGLNIKNQNQSPVIFLEYWL